MDTNPFAPIQSDLQEVIRVNSKKNKSYILSLWEYDEVIFHKSIKELESNNYKVLFEQTGMYLDLNKTIEGGEKCKECKKYEGKMKKAYSTEMFEHLVKGEKIAVFCSMINKIKYSVGSEEAEWEYSKKTEYSASLAEMENILRSNNTEKEQIQMSFDKEGTLKETKMLNNVFKLKQTYLVKII